MHEASRVACAIDVVRAVTACAQCDVLRSAASCQPMVALAITRHLDRRERGVPNEPLIGVTRHTRFA